MSIDADDHPRNDHRRLGRELGYFASDDILGAGLPMWLPAGAAVRGAIERFVVDLERRAGYQHVYTPPLAKRELYERSGHWENFGDDMFPPLDMGNDELVLRPMNCPHHMRVFAVGERSYRDLPVRIAELGAMFRRERSGVLGGLSRVRGMTLNDGHVFCAPEHVADELASTLDLMRRAHDAMGVEVHRYRLSLRGDGGKFADDDGAWRESEALLRAALDAAGIDYEPGAGEAAFYGPKLDVQVLDAAGREETLSTMQVDAILPRRLGLSYVGADGRDHAPIAVHRSLVSTMERMVAHLLERHAGALPVWLAPVQIVVLPVNDDAHAAAMAVVARGREVDLRIEVDDARRTLSARIRDAARSKVPYVAVVGAREAAAGSVSVRTRDGSSETLAVEAFVARVAAESAATR